MIIFLVVSIAMVMMIPFVQSVNVALHAQVNPINKQIVGSVITTDGLKAALMSRFDIQTVSVFYPSAYVGFLDTEWDLVVIEGWFRSINEFIQLTRNRFRDVKIFYLCLDGHYPPFDSLIRLDLDGILTNSEILLERISTPIYKSHMLLAADSELMQPNMNVSRNFGAVFVGAGGPMLRLKPGLFEVLVDAIPYNLRLHGFHWEDVPILSSVSCGPLPRFDIAQAYSSAHVVITSAIEAQDRLGMVNNRVFEALSCGAVMVSQYSATLERLLVNRTSTSTDGAQLLDLVVFIDDNHSIQQIIETVTQNKEYFDEVRRQGREFVLARHTWRHRAVQLMEFYRQISHGYPIAPSSTGGFCAHASRRCSRPNCPRLLWVVSEHLQQHQDYLLLTAKGADSLRGVMCGQYSIDLVSEEDFLVMIRTTIESAPQCDVASVEQSCVLVPVVTVYDVLLAVATPFDDVDRAVAALSRLSPAPEVHGRDRLQKRMMYMLGVDLARVTNYARSLQDEFRAHERPVAAVRKVLSTSLKLTYDAIFYRSPFELSLLRMVGVDVSEFRLQHVFGVGHHVLANSAHDCGSLTAVFVCFHAFRSLCKLSERQNALSRHLIGTADDNRSVVLLLLGGQWSDWVAAQDVVRLEDIDRTVHVAQGQWSDESVSIVQRAHHVFVMQGPDRSGEAVGDLMRDCLSADDPSPPWCLVETLSDSLWPAVAAAVSERTSEGGIHLKTSSAHLMTSLGSDGASEWSASSLAQNVRFGLDRLHGFGPTRSSLNVEQLIMRKVGDRIVCENCRNDVDELLLRSNYLATGMSASEGGVLLRLDYSSFEVGRDGEACFSTAARGNEDRVCLMRPFRYLKLRVHQAVDVHRVSSVDLRITLRGTFYADTFHEQKHTFALSVRETAELDEILTDVSVLGSIFVYDVYL